MAGNARLSRQIARPLGAAQSALIVLRALGVWELSWWWVFAPTWLLLSCAILVFATLGIIFSIAIKQNILIEAKDVPKAAPVPSRSLTPHMAAIVLAGPTRSPAQLLEDPRIALAAYRSSALQYHPDHGGSREMWNAVSEAWGVLKAHHGTIA